MVRNRARVDAPDLIPASGPDSVNAEAPDVEQRVAVESSPSVSLFIIEFAEPGRRRK